MSNKLLILFLVTIFSGPNCIINASQKIKEQSFVKKASKRKENKPTKKVMERAQHRKIFFLNEASLNEASNKKETSFAKKVIMVVRTIAWSLCILSICVSCLGYAMKQKHEARLQPINQKFFRLHNEGKMHDESGMNYFQAIYSNAPDSCSYIYSVLVKDNPERLRQCVEDTKYKGKTIFYQALEEENIMIVDLLSGLQFFSDGNRMKLNFFNHHPDAALHPLERLYQIDVSKSTILNSGLSKSLRKEIAEKFIENGLNKEGLEVLEKCDKSLYDEYFTGQNG